MSSLPEDATRSEWEPAAGEGGSDKREISRGFSHFSFFLKEHEQRQGSPWPFEDGESPATSQIRLYPAPPGKDDLRAFSGPRGLPGDPGWVRAPALSACPRGDSQPRAPWSPWSALRLQPEAPGSARPRARQAPRLSAAPTPSRPPGRGVAQLQRRVGAAAARGQSLAAGQRRPASPLPGTKGSLWPTRPAERNLGGSHFFPQRRPFPGQPRRGLQANPAGPARWTPGDPAG